jgi:hypothetical protein
VDLASSAMRSQVASVVDHKTIHGIGGKENDPHAESSDFLDVRDHLLDPVIPFQWNQYLLSHDLSPSEFTVFSSTARLRASGC